MTSEVSPPSPTVAPLVFSYLAPISGPTPTRPCSPRLSRLPYPGILALGRPVPPVSIIALWWFCGPVWMREPHLLWQSEAPDDALDQLPG